MNGEKKIQIGDLVTFNCAGSKGKTLALVLDIKEERRMRRVCGEIIPPVHGWFEVQWIQVARFMPRHHPPQFLPRPRPGDITRHPACTAFEVIE
jgi:hypothetical protein